MNLDIKTADELVDRDLEARWAARRHGPQAELLRWILRAFAEHGGPVAIGQVEAAFPYRAASAVRDDLAALDEQDLTLLVADAIALAYPFSATATPFLVRFEDGRERFACCATDALAIAAMLGTRIANPLAVPSLRGAARAGGRRGGAARRWGDHGLDRET
jgi:hypothetical protein